MRSSILELHKDEFSFSAGHFTIFSQTEREELHGHNYYVSVALHVSFAEKGLAFDYRDYKQKLKALCDKLDRRFLLPAHSPYLKIEEKDGMILGHYGEEIIPFLKRDAVLLPVTNVTIEELSHWFLNQLIEKKEAFNAAIHEITVKVFNGPGQSGAATWSSA